MLSERRVNCWCCCTLDGLIVACLFWVLAAAVRALPSGGSAVAGAGCAGRQCFSSRPALALHGYRLRRGCCSGNGPGHPADGRGQRTCLLHGLLGPSPSQRVSHREKQLNHIYHLEQFITN